MSTESFYTDLVIDTPAAAKAFEEVVQNESTYIPPHCEISFNDPVIWEKLKKSLLKHEK
ncbi:MAG: hypothetical protein MJZ21_03270 [archaeon]|nr:hypothetical protein [archaeon]